MPQETRDLSRFAWLSIAAALVTITLKTVAWQLTGSVGLLSDAAESVVNEIRAAGGEAVAAADGVDDFFDGFGREAVQLSRDAEPGGVGSAGDKDGLRATAL